MKQDAIKWNQRHQNGFMPQTPSDFLVSFASSLPKGRVLDIACGNGRNARFLAQKGFFCECVDISEVAISSLKGMDNILAIQADLDSYVIKTDCYEAIIDFYFLDRNLFSQIKKALKVGGIFLMETFIEDKDFVYDIPPQRVLKKGELEEVFSDFEILHTQEKIIQRLAKEVKAIEFGARKK